MNTLVNVGLVIVLVSTALNVGSYKEKVENMGRELDFHRAQIAQLREISEQHGRDLVKTTTDTSQILTILARLEARINYLQEERTTRSERR